MKTHPESRAAQKALAAELTEMVHGTAGLTSALKITDTFFSGSFDALNEDELNQGIASMHTSEICEGTSLIDALVDSKIVPSKREVRQLLKTNSIRVNGKVVDDETMPLDRSNSLYGKFVIRKGKKNYFVLVLNG